MAPGRTVLGAWTVVAVAVAVAAAGCGSSGGMASSPTEIPALIARSEGSVGALVTLKIKGRPYIFKVDTGATNTIVDSTVAKALALPDSGPAAVSTSLGCTTAVQPVAISDWKLGDTTLPAMRVASEKTQFAGLNIKGVPLAGLLGVDVLSRFKTVTLDFAGRRLIVGGKPPSGGKNVPVQITPVGRGGDLVETQVTIGAKTVIYAVDTGAGSTQIDSRTTKELSLGAVGPSHTLSVVSCSTTVTPVRIARWAAGGVPLPPTVAGSSLSSITDATKGRVVGLLGADVLSRFGEVTIDFARSAVVLGGSLR